MTILRMTCASVAALTFVGANACQAPARKGADAGAAGPSGPSLRDMFCDGARRCADLDYRQPGPQYGAQIGVNDCLTHQVAVLYGSWSLDDAGSRPFEWEAPVWPGGIFPTLGHVAANFGCGNQHPQEVSPEALVGFDLDGFDWARLQGDDVFIPVDGKATIDHGPKASATFDERAGRASPRATVSIEGPHGSSTIHAGVERGDSFPWGNRRATVVRVVASQGKMLVPIGWIEVALSDGMAPAPGP
jgi:hypothetical protein